MINPQPIKWSTQLQIRPSPRLQGDKITLPQSALEALLNAAPVVEVQSNHRQTSTPSFNPFNPYSFAAETQARSALNDRQQQLPHPLTFRLVNPSTSRSVYAGIREFSAEEGTIGLSSTLLETLGYPTPTSRESTPDLAPAKPQTVTIHAHTLEKGTYVRLRPLEAGYDAQDWKALLERYLRDTFTTLTNNAVLTVPGARHEEFRFLVDKVLPEGEGVCIVDTDLSVDIEALNEEQARETLERRLRKAKKLEGGRGSSQGGRLEVGKTVRGQVGGGEYVDYEVGWEGKGDVEVVVEAEEGEVDVFVSPFSARLRAKPRVDEHVFGAMDGGATKRLKLRHTNVELEEAEYLNVSVHSWRPEGETGVQREPVLYSIKVSKVDDDAMDTDENSAYMEHAIDEVVCKNCKQMIPKRTLPLHEAFCYRNNISCPKCSQVFLKNSDSWKSHWHCSHDDGAFGNSALSQQKHDDFFHSSTTFRCPSCDFEAYNISILAQHRTTTCPAKEILCQFCHLLVPQQSPEDPAFTDAEVLLSGLTPHEYSDGARTTDCHLCKRIVRLRDMNVHMKFHDRERITRQAPQVCSNSICGRTIKSGDEMRVRNEQYSLCNECFGPLYIGTYDPEGKMLRRRIERRLLQQLIGGCGKEWCQNKQWCKTGFKNSTNGMEERILAAKDALPLIKPVLEQLTKGVVSGLVFCVDEAAQRRRATADMVTAEAIYELSWCIKALEESHDNLASARSWLHDRAPKIGETTA